MNGPLFRASMFGKLMTDPRSKSEGPLSQGAKTAIRDLAAQHILGCDFEIGSREIDKGNECEGDSISLLCRVRGLDLTKNAERRSNEWATGECDLWHPAGREGFDLKTAWSAATFPIIAADIGGSQRSLYEWQCRVYMALWDADRWHVAYALVNTPEHLIGREPHTLHFFDHIPEHMRLTVWTIERDRALEAVMQERARHAQDYYRAVLAEFDRTHPATGCAPRRWCADEGTESQVATHRSAAAQRLARPNQGD